AGAAVAADSGVRDGEFLVALDVHVASDARLKPSRYTADRTRYTADRTRSTVDRSAKASAERQETAVIRLASRVEREWLGPTGSEIVHRFDRAGVVRASIVERYGAIPLAERPTTIDPERAASLLANAWRERGQTDADEQLLRRLRFAGRTVDLAAAIERAAREVASLGELTL